MLRGSLSKFQVCLFGHGRYARGVNPAVVEIEQRADGDGVIDCLPRAMIHFGDKAKEGFILLGKCGAFQIVNRVGHQLFTAQQFRRNCGVILRSKQTPVPRRREGGDKFSQARAERRCTTHDLLREAA